MATMDLATLTAPIEEGDPCGPDLDLDEDDPYMNFFAGTEMALPADYMVETNTGDRVPFHTDERFKSLDLASRIATGFRLVRRTHDLRLLSLLAKLAILNRSVPDFVMFVVAMATLCDRFWDEVHPRGETDDHALRIGAIERLDEPLIVAALNNAALFRSKSRGVITWLTYRSIARQGAGDRDEVKTEGLDRSLAEENRADPSQLVATQTLMDQLSGALDGFREVCVVRASVAPPNLRRLVEAVTEIRAMLDRIRPPEGRAATADPEQAVGRETRDPGESAGRPALIGTPAFATADAASRALDSAAAYFATSEPSSPALLLLRQAQALVGKSFLQAVAALWPDQSSRAFLSIGSSAAYNVPLTQLAENGASADTASDEDDDRPGEPELPPVKSRAEALGVLDQVGAFYRDAEPSSPIPLLIERARALVGRDFMSLLRAVLPEDP